jgi:opacity protein-like surface antigen
MKATLVSLIALSCSAFAGEPAAKPEAAACPSSCSNLWKWFAGASVGHLSDFDEEIYSLHVGVDTPYQVAGFDTAVFAEIGYTDKEGVGNPYRFFDMNEKVKVIPITLNAKLERPVWKKVSAYFGGGLGLAHENFSLTDGFGNAGSSDTNFAAQAFAGVLYNLCPHSEIYAGVKYLYIDDSAPLTVGSDIAVEAGLRYNF